MTKPKCEFPVVEINPELGIGGRSVDEEIYKMALEGRGRFAGDKEEQDSSSLSLKYLPHNQGVDK